MMGRKFIPGIWLLFLIFSLSGCAVQGPKEKNSSMMQLEQIKKQITAEEVLFLTAMDNDQVVAVDLTGGEILATQKVGNKPQGIALVPEKNLILVASASSEVWFLHLTTLEILGKTRVGKLPAYIAVDNKSELAYVSNFGGTTVSVVDIGEMKTIDEIEVGKSPYKLAVTSRNQLVVTNHENGTLVVMDLTGKKMINSFSVPGKVSGLAANPNGEIVFTSGEGKIPGQDVIMVHDLASGVLLDTIEVAGRIADLGISPCGNRLHVLVKDKQELLTFQAWGDYPIMSAVKTGKGPFDLTLNDTGVQVLVTNMEAGYVQVIDVFGQKILKTAFIPGGPAGLAYYNINSRAESSE